MGARRVGKGKVITMGTPMPECAERLGRAARMVRCERARRAHCIRLPGCAFREQQRPVRCLRGLAQDRESTKGRGTLFKEPATVTLTVPGTQATMVSVLTGAPVTGKVVGDKVEFAGLKVEPLESYAFLRRAGPSSPRPLAWLKLQCQWWKGTSKPAPAPELRPHRNTLSLDADWVFLPLPAQLKDARPLVGPAVDDSTWTRMAIGVWYGPKFPDTKRGVFASASPCRPIGTAPGEPGFGYAGQVRATPPCRRTRCRSSWTVNP